MTDMPETETPVPSGRTRATKAVPEPPVAANDQAELTLEALAQGILSRKVRPRTSDIRRLAEAVLAPSPEAKPKKVKALANGKDEPKADKKAAKKKKKLAKIPGQKAKK
jgi:hypothetical protein